MVVPIFAADTMRLRSPQKLVPRDAEILLDDLVEKPWADFFARVMRNRGSPAVGMPIHHVAARGVGMKKPESLNDLGQLLARQTG
jgi:hypothetical protein